MNLKNKSAQQTALSPVKNTFSAQKQAGQISQGESPICENSLSQFTDTIDKMNQAILQCDKEKETLLDQIQKLKEEKKNYKGDEKILEKWREFPKIVENSLLDLDANIQQVADLKFMRKKIETDISQIKSQISSQRKALLSKYTTPGKLTSQIANDSRSTDQLRSRQLIQQADPQDSQGMIKEQYDRSVEKLKEKTGILSKVEANITQNQIFRSSIYNVIKTVIGSIVGQVLQEKVQYFDLKYCMCNLLQEFQKLNIRYQESLAQIFQIQSDYTKYSTQQDITGLSRYDPKNILNSIDADGIQPLSLNLATLHSDNLYVEQNVRQIAQNKHQTQPALKLVQPEHLRDGTQVCQKQREQVQIQRDGERLNLSQASGKSGISKISKYSKHSKVSKRYQKPEDEQESVSESDDERSSSRSGRSSVYNTNTKSQPKFDISKPNRDSSSSTTKDGKFTARLQRNRSMIGQLRQEHSRPTSSNSGLQKMMSMTPDCSKQKHLLSPIHRIEDSKNSISLFMSPGDKSIRNIFGSKFSKDANYPSPTSKENFMSIQTGSKTFQQISYQDSQMSQVTHRYDNMGVKYSNGDDAKNF